MIEMKTAADIILETLQFYGQDPVGKRGLRTRETFQINSEGVRETKTHSSCEYAITNGETKYCAVGRCLTDEAKAWVVDVSGGIEDLIKQWWRNSWQQEEFENSNDNPDLLYYDQDERQDPENEQEVYLDDMLQPAYTGQDVEFWQKLQELHDDNINWDGGGELWLTEDGYSAVGEMADMFIPDHDERDAFMVNVHTHTEGAP